MAKKYLSVLSDGTVDYNIKDAEARERFTARVVNVSSNLSNQTTNIIDGQEETVLYKNTGNAEYTITISSTYSSPDGQQLSLTCPVGGYCEVSYLNIGNTIYVRGV